MTRKVINQLKNYTLGKMNTDKVEISVLKLNRIIKALEQKSCEDLEREHQKTKALFHKMVDENDAISRQAVLDKKELVELEDGQSFYCISPEDVETLPPVQPKYNTSEWCHDCSEYDHDKHCCPRYNKVIRNAVEEIKQPKTGYISIDNVMSVFDDFMCGEVDEDGIDTFLEMLKDKAESEE